VDEKEIKKLIEEVGSENLKVRNEAVDRLVEMGKYALPTLIDILKNDTPWQGKAAGVLRTIADMISEEQINERWPEYDLSVIVPVLIEALKDKHDEVRGDAAYALAMIRGTERAVPALFDALKNEDDDFTRSEFDKAINGILDRSVREGNYPAALRIIKALTSDVREKYEGKKDRDSLKKRRERLSKFESLTQQIYDKMKRDKKKFPVKHQPDRRTQARKAIRSG